MKKLSVIFIFLIFATNFANAKHLHPEKFYQKSWCEEQKGILEYKLSDDTRVDCLTKDYAVEFDFASKWAEAIGQSLHYSIMTGKKAGINLIIEDENDFKYYRKIEPLCKMYNITLWHIEPKDIKEQTVDNTVEYIINLIVNIINFVLSMFS